MPLLAASGAQADVASCAFTGAAGPIDPGVFSVQHDLNDGALPDSQFGDPLTDTDNGSAAFDGTYSFNNGAGGAGACLTVDTTDDQADTGLYTAVIDSHGRYENTVCGTGIAEHTAGDGRPATTVDLTATPGALGPGEDITEALYRIQFAAGNGPLDITAANTTGGQTLSGDGAVNIEPTVGNCVTTDVTQFQASGAFVVQG